MSNENEKTISLLKVFADAVTAQAKVVNRIWLATLTVSFLVLVPKPSPQEPIDLPFSLGEADQATFYPLSFVILSVLVIALAAAHMQQIRAHKLAHGIIDKLELDGAKLPDSLHPRDLFDILAVPSLTRLAPLAQWIRGKYQFAENEKDAPAWLRVLSLAFYIILKLVALAVFFALPGIALFY